MLLQSPIAMVETNSLDTTAIGHTGEPVTPRILSGKQTNRNSYC
jgi:hypothetical protein